MPDCMRGYGQSVDRLDRSLVWSINRLRAVTPSTLSEVLFGLLVRPTSRSDYRTGAIGLLGFYRFYRFYLYRAFGLLSFMLFPISDFRFMSYFIFRMLSMLSF
ncbi:hypothetical protein IGI04_009693 [Brassica rapa subsp. trilocularis]|uniref:Uncharacterized protein n=1 Tax=Brassica rapa subsp. trilocularis TaxID=1813537 RepID=A0ABQ7N1C8_BRACM|nr:hypothetical protein IGI04_009693 [Brassica rapa subsp. trilocularis]